jgi:hypothetical protein
MPEIRWLLLAEAAQLVGLPMWQMRRRLKAMDRAFDGKILRRFPPDHRLWVNRRLFVEAMRAEDIERDQESTRSELEHHARQIDSLKRRVRALEQSAGSATVRDG